jgi:hypothetical protein
VSWRVLGASVAGFLHVEQERGCDDAHGWSADPALTVIAIADGAGSRPGTSAIGAHLAVASVLEATSDRGFGATHAKDPTAAATAVVEQAIEMLAEAARDLGIELGALATTLCVALLDGERATVAQIGDGVAAVERASGAIEAVAIAERFEYANEVVFLTASDALEHLKIFTATGDPVRSVALSTDGLRYKVLDDLQATRPFEQFFQESWAYARSEQASSAAIEEFLRDVDDQTGDDKTLVLAVSDFAGVPGEARHLTDRPPQPPPPAGRKEKGKPADTGDTEARTA